MSSNYYKNINLGEPWRILCGLDGIYYFYTIALSKLSYDSHNTLI